MKKIAQNILDNMEKLSFDDMDNFDKFDYFRDNIEDDINFLCSRIVDEDIVYIDSLTDKEINEMAIKVAKDYKEKSEVVLDEYLLTARINENMSIKDAAILYGKIVKLVEGDRLVHFRHDIVGNDIDPTCDFEILE